MSERSHNAVDPQFPVLLAWRAAHFHVKFVYCRSQLLRGKQHTQVSGTVLYARYGCKLDPWTVWEQAWKSQRSAQEIHGLQGQTETKGKEKENKPTVPAIIMSNIQSLWNKTDELAALVKTQREFSESSLLRFAETWVQPLYPGPQHGGARLFNCSRGQGFYLEW